MTITYDQMVFFFQRGNKKKKNQLQIFISFVRDIANNI